MKRVSAACWTVPRLPTMNSNYLLSPTRRERNKKNWRNIAKNLPNLMKKNVSSQIPETEWNLSKINIKRIHCQTADSQRQRENLETSKIKIIFNNMINNWFLIRNKGDQMAVYNDILKVLIWKNKVNEELNIVYVCVCVCIIYKCKLTKHSTQKAEIAKLNE